MDKITLEVEIGRDHRLVDALPPEVPIGRVRLVIEPVQSALDATVLPGGSRPASNTNPAREAIRARMMAAGILSTAHRAPEGSSEATPEERARVWKLFSQGRSSEEMIDEDRGLY